MHSPVRSIGSVIAQLWLYTLSASEQKELEGIIDDEPEVAADWIEDHGGKRVWISNMATENRVMF